MSREDEFEGWVASVSRGDCGFTYIRFYADAPEWVRDTAVNRFGKGTVFLPPAETKPKAAAAYPAAIASTSPRPRSMTSKGV